MYYVPITSSRISAGRCVCTGSNSSIVDIAVSNEDFSTLVAAAQAADIVDTLAADGPLDVFAPTDEAFANALASLGITADQLLAQTDLLRKILAYHVVAEGAACDGTPSGVLNTLLPGQTLQVDGSTVTDGLGEQATIIATVPASNGQIFVIDAVLLPQTDDEAPPAPEVDDDGCVVEKNNINTGYQEFGGPNDPVKCRIIENSVNTGVQVFN